MSVPAVHGGASRRSLGRWLVALVATVLLVVSGSGLVAFAQTGGPTKGPVFVPQGSAVYVEARLDMPEGQAEALAQFLTAFPGFADAATFEMKTDEAFESIISEATDGEVTFSQLSAFATGEVGLAITEFTPAAMEDDDPPMIVGVAISDRAAAEAFVDTLVELDDDDDFSEQAVGDTTMLVSDDAAIAVHDEWIILGTSADLVASSVSTLDGSAPSLADDAEFSTSFGRLPSSRLGAFYLDLQSMTSLVEMAADEADMEMLGTSMEEALAQLPIDMSAYLAAEADRLTLEAFITPSPAMAEMVSVGDSDLATRFPADTQLFVETRALGQTLATALGSAFAAMGEEESAQLAPFEDMLGTDLESILDFVDDAAIGGSLDSDGLWLGIAAEVVDEATATTRIDRLLSLVRLFAAESGISVTEGAIDGATVTTITLPMDEMGSPIPIGDSIDITVTDGTLLIGTGDFVENALAGTSADSLAESPGYLDALGDDTPNAGVLFANVSALLSSVDPLLSMMLPEWEEIAPYATAIDRIVAVGGSDEVISSRMTVIVDS